MSLERPPITFKIKVDGENQEIKLTYGLFREISALFPDPDNIAELLITSPGLRDYVVRRVLTPGKVDKEEDLIDLDDKDISLDEIDDLVVWVGDHILYFFTTSMKKVVTLSEKYQDTVHQLSQSKNGLKDSDSPEASVGLSDAANLKSTTSTGDTPTTT